jgi:hypothetical protein
MSDRAARPGLYPGHPDENAVPAGHFGAAAAVFA